MTRHSKKKTVLPLLLLLIICGLSLPYLGYARSGDKNRTQEKGFVATSTTTTPDHDQKIALVGQVTPGGAGATQNSESDDKTPLLDGVLFYKKAYEQYSDDIRRAAQSWGSFIPQFTTTTTTTTVDQRITPGGASTTATTTVVRPVIIATTTLATSTRPTATTTATTTLATTTPKITATTTATTTTAGTTGTSGTKGTLLGSLIKAKDSIPSYASFLGVKPEQYQASVYDYNTLSQRTTAGLLILAALLTILGASLVQGSAARSVERIRNTVSFEQLTNSTKVKGKSYGN